MPTSFFFEINPDRKVIDRIGCSFLERKINQIGKWSQNYINNWDRRDTATADKFERLFAHYYNNGYIGLTGSILCRVYFMMKSGILLGVFIRNSLTNYDVNTFSRIAVLDRLWA